jgi:hypothetical protein
LEEEEEKNRERFLTIRKYNSRTSSICWQEVLFKKKLLGDQ